MAIERALSTLAKAGARIEHRPFPVVDEIITANATGGFSAPEAYAWHKQLLETSGDRYDPRVRARILRGAEMTAAQYIDLVAERARLISAMDEATAPYDALLMPTVPIVPPRIDDLAEDTDYTRINLQMLRNTAIGNFLDRCAISLPCHRAGEAPVGLMLMGETMGDARLFAIAAGVEAAIAG
jgi:aspartyl-tRNA(Asn)/glutamyl-tRNA(Gln) amidotransferase subunit A